MKKSILLLVVFALVITTSAQNKKEVKVSEKAKATFAKHYPTVKEVKWGKEGKFEYEAEFKFEGKATSLVIDEQGNLKETEIDIAKSELPKGVDEFVAKNHKGWAITEAAKIVDAKGNITFEAQISKDKLKKDLMFTQDGKPVVKKEAKSGKDEKDEKEEK
ncbi:MAG: PepSY-like domain-containing protein [Melioribacteraceae bacterium]